jgi:hypothetical protein
MENYLGILFLGMIGIFSIWLIVSLASRPVKPKEPLPCPFCKSNAQVITRKKTGKRLAYDVTCTNSSCYLFDGAYSFFSTEKEAIDSWNNRK